MNYVDWNSHELARQIQALGFGQYASLFIKNEVCGIHLPLITEEHLIEMGVTKIGHRVLLIRRFSDIVNNKIPSQSASSVSSTINSRYSSPNIDQNNTDNAYNDDNTTNNDFKRRDIPRSPNTKRFGDQTETSQQKPAVEKKYSRMTKNTPTDDSDGSSYSSTSHRSRSTRNSSTKNKSNLSNINNNSNSNFGATESINRSSRGNPSSSSSINNDQNVNISQENDNRITCQYCGRKFQPEAAQRHIPVCGRINGRNLKK